MSPGRLETPSNLAADVLPREYDRLLGYPPDRAPEGAVLALANACRDWYARHGRPWVFDRTVAIIDLTESTVDLAGDIRLESRELSTRLRDAEAPAVIAVTVSAGPEVDQRVDHLWNDARPDEAFFLDRFGAAVAEHLATWCGDTLRAPGSDDLSALPGYSPGYDGWSLGQQVQLFELLAGRSARSMPGPLSVLESGMLTPRNSLLAVFGLTPHRELAIEAWARHRCAWCSLADCGLRRKPTFAQRDSDPDSG